MARQIVEDGGDNRIGRGDQRLSGKRTIDDRADHCSLRCLRQDLDDDEGLGICGSRRVWRQAYLVRPRQQRGDLCAQCRGQECRPEATRFCHCLPPPWRSHERADHLLKVNPAVKIYAPQEKLWGVRGATLPARSTSATSRFLRTRGISTENHRNPLRSGSPWPEANFTWIAKTTEVAPGVHLILLNGTWGADLEVKEISLAIDTPDGIVLIVGRDD